jgi:NADH-quinone oxidoreductase subunit E
MIQIDEKVYEDLTQEQLEGIIDDIAAGKEPRTGPQNGRVSSEPLGGATTLTDETLYNRGSDAEALIKAAKSGKSTSGKTASGKAVGGTAKSGAASAKAKPAKGGAKSDSKPASKPAGKKPASAAPAPVTLADLDKVEEKAPELTKEKPAEEDDLKMISGIGPKIEGILHDLGVWTFAQIASWGPAEIKWVDARLKFKGRIVREDWVAQADALAAGGRDEYVKRFGKEPR